MKNWRSRGRKVRAKDKNCVFSFFLTGGALIFGLVLLLFYLNRLLAFDWDSWSLIRVNAEPLSLNIPYLMVTILTASVACAVCAAVYWRFCPGRYTRLVHRQKLAEMILQNGWYEAEQYRPVQWFKTQSTKRSRERITMFPRMYYKMEGDLITITVQIVMGKYQDKLLALGEKLEAGLYCDVMEMTVKEGYAEYVLLYDPAHTRIKIDQMAVSQGRMKLMENVYWAFDQSPHMLVVGGTGSGKTWFLLMLIQALAGENAVLHIADPKCADLADLDEVLPNVYYKSDDITACIATFCAEMHQRQAEMKQVPGYKTGGNYASVGLPAHFLIFDEYSAFMEMLGKQQSADVMANLKQIAMMGRQAGFFLILACQRPDAKYLGDGIRDQFNFRVGLGKMSNTGYGMIFGSQDKVYMEKAVKGRGYVDAGKGVISEFYTPKVPPEYDFLTEIEAAYASRSNTEAE